MGNDSTMYSEIHELLGTTIRSFLMMYISEVKVKLKNTHVGED